MLGRELLIGRRSYAIVIEKADNNYSAYVPDVPGCIATGATVEEVKRNLAEALQLHRAGVVLKDRARGPERRRP